MPPPKIRHQDGFRPPLRLAGADGAPLRQLRDSRAWRCKAQSRSRPGRPWRFCPDRLHPFPLCCLVESVPMEPNQNPCPCIVWHLDGFRRPVRLAGAAGAPLRPLRALRASIARPDAGQGVGAPHARKRLVRLAARACPRCVCPVWSPC